MKQSANFNSD